MRVRVRVGGLSAMEVGGSDSDGREFKNAAEMWREEVGDHHKKTQWYTQGVGYWESVEASEDGVLGGYGHVNDPDIKSSEAFLNTLLSDQFTDEKRNRHLVVLDCGAGIGRVTRNLLIRYFNEVDLLEPVSHFLEAAREKLAPEHLVVSDSHKASNFYCLPLQGGLKPGGLFVLKENIARAGFVLDKEDWSVTRSDSYFKELFQHCGLHIYKSKDQKGFPEELFPVKMYALTPDLPKRANGTRPKVQTNKPGIIK
ncbi:alpha N-terminal protein methyltransferase 1 isoform X2 [Actinidia eriantha]|uniref:alpha N-terminal protein methyltransferase 1 isoform X2 n=1 Tax=Actinidia eriantha TaxID=165200 RepID=UPI0025885EBB|nr:alpha N-terminal protein methyltransferase 1 isoform X2 [Actinidia eriantha]